MTSQSHLKSRSPCLPPNSNCDHQQTYAVRGAPLALGLLCWLLLLCFAKGTAKMVCYGLLLCSGKLKLCVSIA